LFPSAVKTLLEYEPQNFVLRYEWYLRTEHGQSDIKAQKNSAETTGT